MSFHGRRFSGALLTLGIMFGLLVAAAASPPAGSAQDGAGDRPVADEVAAAAAIPCVGAVVCSWGSNGNGQLGNGTQTSQLTPLGTDGVSGVLRLDAGGTSQRSFSLAVKSDGTAWAWGGNGYGQLGDGTTTDQLSPVPVAGLTGVVAVAAGGFHALALKSDGTVWAWGYNGSGQLGNGTNTNSTTPVPVSGLTGITDIAAGDQHSLALQSGGTVWGWGANTYGGLGDGTGAARSLPLPVAGFAGATDVAAGDFHSVARLSNGTVWATGYNQNGELGDGTGVTQLLPVQASGLTGVASIDAGAFHTVALLSDGTVWAWGVNANGQVGDGASQNRLSPVAVSGLSGVSRLAAGHSHTFAIKNDGALWGWGWNQFGQVGDGATSDVRTPVQVAGIARAAGAAGGHRHSLALSEAVTPTPTATATATSTPTPVPTPLPVPFISASPNPVPAGAGVGTTVISWDTTDGSQGQVRVSVDGGAEVMFANGPSGSQEAPWIVAGPTYRFRLYWPIAGGTATGVTEVVVTRELPAGTPTTTATATPTISTPTTAPTVPGATSTPPTATLTATVPAPSPTATPTPSSVGGAQLQASPNPVPAGGGLGTTVITWKTNSLLTGQVWVSVDGGTEVLFATGPSGSASAPWIVEGLTYSFRLYVGSSLLAEVTVTRAAGPGATATATPPSVGGAQLQASPNPVPAGSGVGTTTITWTTGTSQVGQVWVSIDGGTEVLFAEGASGSADAPWILSGVGYAFRLYTGTGHATVLAQVTVTRAAGEGTAGISADPNPVPAGPGLGATTITWTGPEGSYNQVWVTIGGPEVLFAEGIPRSQEAPWIVAGNTYTFTLYQGVGHTEVLAEVVVTRTG